MKKILVVGGAGCVGSSMCAWLLDQGYRVWVLDDLSTGHRELVLGHGFVQARAGDRSAVLPLLRDRHFDAVMHFAAKSLVAESFKEPELYRENNVGQTRALLELMLEAGVRDFVFSSSCAIFGNPGTEKISETTLQKPVNPYGATKLEAERVLAEFAEKGLRSVALRYFNAAGAEPMLRVGEWHEPESHLIPTILRNAALKRPCPVFGTDYPTRDGTCVRDYVHVWDLAEAHGAALDLLFRLRTDDPERGTFRAFNLGSENGFSVREVIDVCERVTGEAITRVESDRRAGDPPRLVSDSELARRELGFLPRSSDLDTILKSAQAWEKRRTSPGSARAVFLDRDGTLNEDPGYLSDPSQLKLLPGVGGALARLRAAGYLLVVVSNQSGVGRGLIPEGALERIHARLDELLAAYGAHIDRYELCLHHPDDECECRKPKPKLLLDAARALGVDPGKSYMVGDKESDIGVGIRAGCRGSVLVHTGEGARANPEGAAFISGTLVEAADWIIGQDSPPSSKNAGS